MSAKTRAYLKSRFQNGVEVNEDDYADLFDSFLNILDDASGFTVSWDNVTDKPTEFPPEAHEHDAADITSGVLDVARIPVLPSQNTVVSSGGIVDITEPQEAEIDKGTTVVTTDGFRWTYIGTGDKTDDDNYIQLADITPEWATIDNKPSTFPPSSHAHVIGDVTGLQAALDSKADKTSVYRTGTALVFDVNAIYGHPTAETGNITVDHTGAVPGTVHLVRHNSGSTPTFTSEFKKIGGTYQTSVLNFIYLHYVSATEINYTFSKVET